MRIFPAAILSFVLLLAVSAAAQEQTGTLQGRATDSSGGVLPGVTVTLSGTAILGGSRTAVTTENGIFRFPNLPVGTYRVSFELEGFGGRVHEAVRVLAATTYTLDAKMDVATVAETVTVSGASPVIDTAATDVGFTFTKEIMSTIPNARDVWAMVAQTPGVTTSNVNVGGTQTGNQVSFRGHGVDPRQNTYLLNGANVSDNTNNGASQFFFDVDSFEEMKVEINAHSAEVQTPGMLLNIIPKSGANKFSGNVSAYYGNDGIQGDNVDDALRARGVNRASNLHKYFDGGFDLGGPILRDKIWFWGAYRYQEVENFITGTQNADGSFPIDRTYLWYPSGKVNWQPAKSHNVSGYFNMAQKKRFKRGLSALRPVETTQDQQGNPIARLFTVRDDWTIGSNMLVSLKVNIMDQGFELKAVNGVDVASTPAQLDQATGVWAGAPPNEFGIAKNLRSYGATVSYFVSHWAGGSHDLKFGADLSEFQAFGNQKDGAQTTYPADHRLIFFNGVPLQVLLFQSGAQSVTYPARSAFGQDSWKLGRVTINAGLRWDWQANGLNATTAPASNFFPNRVSQPQIENLVTWNTFAPRFGLIYDVAGDARTLLKASASQYYWQLWTDKGTSASLVGDRTFTHQWNDNGDRRFQQGEQGNLLSVTDPALQPVKIDPNLKPTRTDEFTAGVTRELMANFSLSATVMYRRDQNLDWRINRGITSADYTAVTGQDPGRDGRLGTSDDGGALVLYELAAAKRGLSPNVIATRPDFSVDFRGIEVQAIRRLANRWQLVASVTAGSHREHYGPGSFQSPQPCFVTSPAGTTVCGLVDQLDGTRLDISSPYVGKVMGSYALPRNVTLSGFFSHASGTNFTRSVNSQSALGRPLNQGNVVVLTGRRNEESFDSVNLLDLRVAYDLPIRQARVSLQLDAFNVLNANTVLDQQLLSGSGFSRVVNFIPPRIFRFGGKIRF